MRALGESILSVCHAPCSHLGDINLKRDVLTSNKEEREWENKYFEANYEFRKVKAENLQIRYELENDKTKAIEAFMDFEEFQDILNKQEDMAYDIKLWILLLRSFQVFFIPGKIFLS